MARQIKWSSLAIADASEIAEYISRDSTFFAKATVERIYDAVGLLAKVPEMGRMVPERNDERIREVIVRPYRVIYRLSDDSIEILGIIHGARLLQKAMAKRLPRPRGKKQ